MALMFGASTDAVAISACNSRAISYTSSRAERTCIGAPPLQTRSQAGLFKTLIVMNPGNK